MTKAWCIWCEKGEMPKHGYYWIHPNCFSKFHATHDRIKLVTKYLNGELPRLSNKGNQIGYDSVEDFLVSVRDFDRKWENLMTLFETKIRKEVNT